jgi:hypothetical protein
MALPIDWTALLAAGTSDRPAPLRAETYLRSFGTGSKPVLLQCSDGGSYVVKGKQAGRQIVNDQVIAALGRLMGAPVPVPALVDVPAQLIALQPELQELAPGISLAPGVSHGSTWVPGCSNQEPLRHTDAEGNNERFAILAVLYGWMQAQDHQFIYATASPHLVHSVDHGHFFAGGPNWTVDTLGATGHADLDATITPHVSWENGLLSDVRNRLTNITDEVIAQAVSRPPDDWGLSNSDRSALASYLSRRRGEMVNKIDERISGA